MAVRIKKVETKAEMNDFIEFPKKLYADCPYYVPDLDIDVRNTFDLRKNASLECSEVQPFIAYNEVNVPVGRIAAIINHRANKKWNVRNMRFSFLDFIDDIEVSSALFEAAFEWGRAKGMDTAQGPLGFFDFDKEGMLVDDFDKLGSIVTFYNYPYYPIHLEKLGFQKEADWIQIHIDMPKEMPAKFARVAQFVKNRFKLHIVKFTDKELKGNKGKDIFHLLNMAYSSLFGYTEYSDSQVNQIVNQFISLVDKRMITGIETENNELVGIAITMASLSNAMRKTNGKLMPFGWFHLLKALKWKMEDTVEMLLIAVHPKYQGLGINTLFFDDLISIYNKLGFKYAETGPQLETNHKELSQWDMFNPQYIKRRRCYKKEI